MLFLLFQIGEVRYALDTAAVLEIVPYVSLRPVPHAPAGVAGLLDYHHMPVPVLDLCTLAIGESARPRFSTRLIVARVSDSGDPAGCRLVGLLAERATTLLRRKPSDFTRAGLHVPGAPLLASVATDAQGFIHRVNLEELLTGEMRHLLAPTREDWRPC